MRNLTITRRKSYVGCIMKDKVYIQDERVWDTTIDGVHCRKIGDIKNGETKTFQIGEGQQQIFLIADKVSKDYCNATVTIPEGQEDVALSGKHVFTLGNNPFRFDGVELTQEQLAKQKKNGRKGAVIMIVAAIIGLAIGLFLPGGFLGKDNASPKTFTKEDFQITLTDDFKVTEEEGFFVSYDSKTVMVFSVREEKEIFGDISLEEYGELVLQANGRTGAKMTQQDGFVWFEYTNTPGTQEVYYLAVCYQSEDAFWIVNFATPASNQGKYRDRFFDWAKTVKVGETT